MRAGPAGAASQFTCAPATPGRLASKIATTLVVQPVMPHPIRYSYSNVWHQAGLFRPQSDLRRDEVESGPFPPVASEILVKTSPNAVRTEALV